MTGEFSNRCTAASQVITAPVCRVFLLMFALWHAPAKAHEFWVVPIPAATAPGSHARFSLMVGEQFQGDLVGVSRTLAADLQHYSAGGVTDLRGQLPMMPAADFVVKLSAPGTNLIAFESKANTISLSSDSFHAYLHDEGLDFVKAKREAARTARQPGRERYRRFVKTLVSVPLGALAAGTGFEDTTHARQLGQQLEILPLNNPLLLAPGDALRVQIVFEDKPLAGALVKAWHRRDGQTLTIRATTAADGRATFNLPYAGPWMVSVVHMVAAKDVSNIDWDSFWGNLTFVMPPS